MAISDGEKVYIKFTQPLTGSVEGNESRFTVSFQAYNYVPGGVLSTVTRPVVSVESIDEYTILLMLAPGVNNSIQRAAGDITISYDGSGSLMGYGGPVLAFSHTFAPIDLDPKNNPNDAEHIYFSDIIARGNIIQVYYTSSQAMEHLSVQSINAAGTLIHVDDI